MPCMGKEQPSFRKTRLPLEARTNPLRMERRSTPRLVRRQRQRYSHRRQDRYQLAKKTRTEGPGKEANGRQGAHDSNKSRQTNIKRFTSNNEANNIIRLLNKELKQARRHNTRPIRRFRQHFNSSRTTTKDSLSHGTRRKVCRRNS